MTEAWVYGIQSGAFIKIGVANDIAARIRTFKLYNPHPYRTVLRQPCTDAYFVERRMHELLRASAIGREWFAISPKEVRAAIKIALQDEAVHLESQREWERQSSKRVRARARTRGRDVDSSQMEA
jgi:T5orf172 domain